MRWSDVNDRNAVSMQWQWYALQYRGREISVLRQKHAKNYNTYVHEMQHRWPTMLADMHSKLQNVGSQFGPANGWFFHKFVAASWDQKEVSRLRLGQMYFFQAFGYSWNRFANNSWGQSDGDAKDPVLFPRFKLRVWTFGWQILIAPNNSKQLLHVSPNVVDIPAPGS